jgi:osmotically-inducible protein OsmY
METATCSNFELRIQNAIVHNPHLNHHHVHLTTNQGQVVLEGKVQSFFEKQMAQESLRRIEGVDSILNHLEVTWC